MKKHLSLLFILCSMGIPSLMSCKKTAISSNGNDTIAQSVVLYRGVLVGGEAGDEARGDVTIEEAAGKKYLVFKNFISNSGPDVHVYLSKTIGNHAMPPTEYKDLGFLKFTSGTFNYELAMDPDVPNYKYVLVWCAQYRIQFGYAELK